MANVQVTPGHRLNTPHITVALAQGGLEGKGIDLLVIHQDFG